jgi:DnaJ family protein C protein 7
MSLFTLLTHAHTDTLLQRIGEIEEEGKGGQIRATILSNRATTFVKVHPLHCLTHTTFSHHSQLNKYEEALLDTEASLALYPTSFKVLRTRARINLHFEKFDAAIADFKMSMEQAKIEGADADVRALMNELKKAQAALKRSKMKDYYNILGMSFSSLCWKWVP